MVKCFKTFNNGIICIYFLGKILEKLMLTRLVDWGRLKYCPAWHRRFNICSKGKINQRSKCILSKKQNKWPNSCNLMLRLLHFLNIFVIKLYLVSVLNKSCTCNNRPVVRIVINTNGIAVTLSIILKRNRLTQKLVRTRTFYHFLFTCDFKRSQDKS